MAIICGDAHRFVDVRKILVVEGIVPLVEGLNINNMLQSMTQSLDQNTRYTKPCVQYKKIELLSKCSDSDFELFTH